LQSRCNPQIPTGRDLVLHNFISLFLLIHSILGVKYHIMMGLLPQPPISIFELLVTIKKS